ncbi:hypothetical protein L486_07154 [Kwoniella mangroviensis CBS 10435]|uniref:Major facilitator superfamily (MFS) profile domain-containing protein n=1 Tax=Kwoniella mangroviensis CBS 10435 TaxID=1331196 RepID=A0A1B9II25_9TREE|nr:hypothetical protein L486_07154 [Kwoniella mangroviensis CBS 10435]
MKLWDFLIIFIGTLPFYVYGIDYGYLGGVLAVPEFVQKYGTYDAAEDAYVLKSDKLSLLSSSAYIGGLIACFVIPWLATKIGTKWGLVITCTTFAVGGALQLGAVNLAMFLVGRILTGVHISSALILGQSYINEVAPAHLRGFGICLCLQLLTFGNFSASVITLGATSAGGKLAYQIPISLCIMVGGLVAIALILMPKTPLQHALKGDWANALAAVVKIRRAPADSQLVRAEMERLHHATKDQVGSSKWSELFQKGQLRRTLYSFGTYFFMNGFSGCNFYLTYASVFMAQAGITNPWGITVLIAGTNCFLTTPALALVERFGRRRLCFIGTIGCILMNLGAGLSYVIGKDTKNSNIALVVFVTLYIVFFAGFMAPSGWAFSAEIPSARLRAKTIAVTNIGNNIVTWAVGYGSPYLFQDPVNLRAKFCFFWLVGCLICGIFFYFCLYETKGLTHTEIDELMASGIPARQSVGWAQDKVRSRVGTTHEADLSVADSDMKRGDLNDISVLEVEK